MSESETGPKLGWVDVQTLFREHARFVASFLQRLGVAASDVDDLVQEVFLVAHRKGGYEQGPAHPRTWLAAIALRVASSSRRTRRRAREQPDESALHAAVAPEDVGRAVEARGSLGLVQRALESLDLQHRAPFVLYEIEGEPCDAIAVALDVPVGTIYSRLHTARRRFLEAYTALEQDVPGGRRSQRCLGGA